MSIFLKSIIISICLKAIKIITTSKNSLKNLKLIFPIECTNRSHILKTQTIKLPTNLQFMYIHILFLESIRLSTHTTA